LAAAPVARGPAFGLQRFVQAQPAIAADAPARHRLPWASSSSALRPFVSATRPVGDKRAVAVPTMGDSITEGTIVEWVAQIGQAVKPDDVVALIETDKVTVEIKATTEGVVTQHFGAVYVFVCVTDRKDGLH
jgi:biotin carboxyl carrier protein